MKKMLRILISAVAAIILTAGVQLTAFATIDTDSRIDEASRIEDEVSALPGTPRAADTDTAANRNETSVVEGETSRLNDVGTTEISPISANPDTGAGNLAIPAAAALLAASTAAITLSAKKK